MITIASCSVGIRFFEGPEILNDVDGCALGELVRVHEIATVLPAVSHMARYEPCTQSQRLDILFDVGLDLVGNAGDAGEGHETISSSFEDRKSFIRKLQLGQADHRFIGIETSNEVFEHFNRSH